MRHRALTLLGGCTHHRHLRQKCHNFSLPRHLPSARRHKTTKLSRPEDPTISVVTQPSLSIHSARLFYSTLMDLLSSASVALEDKQHASPANFDPERLAFGYHSIFFHAPTPPSSLLRDGSEPDQLPPDMRLEIEASNGRIPPPRRLLTGGSIYYSPRAPKTMRYEGKSPLVCLEKTVPSTQSHLTGHTAVDTLRQYGLVKELDKKKYLFKAELPMIHERRSLVLLPMAGNKHAPMRELEDQLAAQSLGDDSPPTSPVSSLSRSRNCDSRLTITPSPMHLFNFSALTYNAHRIHYDTAYAQSEGYRAPLVQGILTSLLMSHVINLDLPGKPSVHAMVDGAATPPSSFCMEDDLFKKRVPSKADLVRAKTYHERIRAIEYRNLAPLFCNEPLTLCVKWNYQEVRVGKEGGMSQYSGEHTVWIEGPDGRLAARAKVTTGIGFAMPHEKELLRRCKTRFN